MNRGYQIVNESFKTIANGGLMGGGIGGLMGGVIAGTQLMGIKKDFIKVHQFIDACNRKSQLYASVNKLLSHSKNSGILDEVVSNFFDKISSQPDEYDKAFVHNAFNEAKNQHSKLKFAAKKIGFYSGLGAGIGTGAAIARR